MLKNDKGEHRMKRKQGIRLAVVIACACLVITTAANASVMEYRLTVNGSADDYTGSSGTVSVGIQARMLENVVGDDGTNDYIGGVTVFGFSLVDSTGIGAGSVLDAALGSFGANAGKWVTTYGAGFTTKYPGSPGSLDGVDYDVKSHVGQVGDLGTYWATYGGSGDAGIPIGTDPEWATLVSGNFNYAGGAATLSIVADPLGQNVYDGTGQLGVNNPTTLVVDTISFGATANDTPTVTIPGGDVLEADWTQEAGWNNTDHSVDVTALGVDPDGDDGALTYAWEITKPGGSPTALSATGAVLHLTLAEIDALGLPAYVGEDDPSYHWSLSVTANDGLDTSDAASIDVFVPEPTTMGLLGFGIVALLKRRRRA